MVSPGENLDARLVERLAGVPDQVADAAQHVVEQRPAEQEQQRAAEMLAKKWLDRRVVLPARRRSRPATRRAGGSRPRVMRPRCDARSTSSWSASAGKSANAARAAAPPLACHVPLFSCCCCPGFACHNASHAPGAIEPDLRGRGNEEEGRALYGDKPAKNFFEIDRVRHLHLLSPGAEPQQPREV